MICTAEGLKMEIPCIRVGECSLEIFVISSVYSMGSISNHFETALLFLSELAGS